mgnify:CR=1 FL=1
MIAVGMMDRKIQLYKRTQGEDDSYGGIIAITYTLEDELIFSQVVWKGGKVDEQGEQMQNNQVIEFYCRNGGVMELADVEDYILYDSKKHYIDVINVIDGREKYLQVITSQTTV